jgi:hypothetical protein
VARGKSDPVPASIVLAHPGPEVASQLWDDVRLQKMWLAVRSQEWRVLAVLAASKSVETYQIAELLAQLAWRYQGQPSSVCDLRDLSLRLVDYQLRELKSQVDAGTRILVSLRSIFENPTATPVARQADAVLLCISLGTTSFKSVEKTIAEVGRERVLGCFVVRPRVASDAVQSPRL